MGHVAKIKKMRGKIGGSARKSVSRNPETQPRWGLFWCHGTEKERGMTMKREGGCWANCIPRSEKRDLLSMSSHSHDYSLHPIEKVYALKSIHLARITDPVFVNELRNEIDILKSLDHPNIVKAIETFEHGDKIYIVTELCSGGDLYSRDPYTEEDAARIIRKVCSAVGYMHRRNITHRDIKYENILFENDAPNAQIKIIDFGLSKKYIPEDPILKEHVGTIYTMAPQVLEGQYDSQADMWSIGVISFMLLGSDMPFFGKRARVIEKIKTCDYKFKSRKWHQISPTAIDFVKSLLIYDPKERMTAWEALDHPFLDNGFDNEKRSVRRRRQSSVARIPVEMLLASIQRFGGYTKLKKLALLVIAYTSTSTDMKDLRKVFTRFDKQKDGKLTFDEFQNSLEHYGFSPQELEIMFHGIDVDQTGDIHYTEFLAATIECLGVIEEEKLAEAFDRLDSDDSGFISIQNLEELFAGELNVIKLEEIIKEANVTEDNKVSYTEFLSLWDHKCETETSADESQHRPR